MPHMPNQLEDHDKLTRIDANVQILVKRFDELESRVAAVEHKIWYGAGVMGLAVFIVDHFMK